MVLIFRIKAVDHYSNDKHILEIQYLLAYGTLIEDNPFYFRISLFWLFILNDKDMWVFHPTGFKASVLNLLQSNIVQIETINI